MPMYEFTCGACGHEFEAMQKMSDPVLTDCPECAKPALKKLISAAGFRLKGSGWYETDFKTGDKRNLHAGDADNKSKPKESSAPTASPPKGKADST